MTQPELEEVGLLQKELRHAREQLFLNARQHTRVVKAWKRRVDRIRAVHCPEALRELQTLKEELWAKIANLSDSLKQMGEERDEQKYRMKLLEEEVIILKSENKTFQERHQIVLHEFNYNASEQEEELKTLTKNCRSSHKQQGTGRLASRRKTRNCKKVKKILPN